MKHYEEYKTYLLDTFNALPSQDRLISIELLDAILLQSFPFNTYNIIETGTSFHISNGCFSLYALGLLENENSKFETIDSNSEHLYSCQKILKNHKNYNKATFTWQDSIISLKNRIYNDDIPNLIFLDSFDLDLKNPFPSALHGWKEFDAIKDYLFPGSIIMIDDNFFQGVWVDWIQNDITERIDIKYPIIGKGTHIYNYVIDNPTEWKILNDKGNEHSQNVKLIIQKL